MATNDRMFTLAEVRAAFKTGALWSDKTRNQYAIDEASYQAYPDPEPERRWVTIRERGGRTVDICRKPDGVWEWRSPDPARGVGTFALGDADVRALASLLPRVPVEVTEAMLEKAAEVAFNARKFGQTWTQAGRYAQEAWRNDMRLALSAVAADLAQPAMTCQHKAQWWALRDKRGGWTAPSDSEAKTRKNAKVFDDEFPDDAPHRVIALAEVEG